MAELSGFVNHPISSSPEELSRSKCERTIVDQFGSREKTKHSQLHTLVGKALVPSATLYKLHEKEIRREYVGEMKKQGYAVKRFTVLVNGRNVDAILVGKREQINNGRWILYSNPNAVSFEEAVCRSEVSKRMDKLQANYLFFNYPGVGCSEGAPNQEDMVASYKAMLHILEDQVGAKEIICWGTSIGGGVQGSALEEYKLKEDVKYVFVKDQTFSSIDQVPNEMLTSDLKKIKGAGAVIQGVNVNKKVQQSGWTLGSVASSEKLAREGKKEVIIQNTDDGNNPKKVSDITGDGVIPKTAALASKLLESPSPSPDRHYIGVQAEHTFRFGDFEEARIDAEILKCLNEQSTETSSQTASETPSSTPPQTPRSVAEDEDF